VKAFLVSLLFASQAFANGSISDIPNSSYLATESLRPLRTYFEQLHKASVKSSSGACLGLTPRGQTEPLIICVRSHGINFSRYGQNAWLILSDIDTTNVKEMWALKFKLPERSWRVSFSWINVRMSFSNGRGAFLSPDFGEYSLLVEESPTLRRFTVACDHCNGITTFYGLESASDGQLHFGLSSTGGEITPALWNQIYAESVAGPFQFLGQGLVDALRGQFGLPELN
jgi:hypothetical protein